MARETKAAYVCKLEERLRERLEWKLKERAGGEPRDLLRCCSASWGCDPLFDNLADHLFPVLILSICKSNRH